MVSAHRPTGLVPRGPFMVPACRVTGLVPRGPSMVPDPHIASIAFLRGHAHVAKAVLYFPNNTPSVQRRLVLCVSLLCL